MPNKCAVQVAELGLGVAASTVSAAAAATLGSCAVPLLPGMYIECGMQVAPSAQHVRAGVRVLFARDGPGFTFSTNLHGVINSRPQTLHELCP